jgi:hypothetical protein
MGDSSAFAPYRPLKFSVRGSFCTGDECKVHPDLVPLQLQIREVHGTSAKVRVGGRYVVRGEYALPGATSFAVSLAVFTKAFGATAYLLPGKGRFEVSTEILELAKNPPNGPGVVVANEQTGNSDIVRWIILAEQ